MNNRRKRLFFFEAFAILSLVLVIIVSCSTEKNTFINRTYHSLTAKYNGYFNARELIRQGLENYRKQAKEDYSEILPLDLFPGEDDVVELYPVVDTAIAKCTKVISKHSMPTASRPARKKTEHAKWIDQNWLLIGKAEYIRRDYPKALKNFKYIRKFYIDRPSTYQGQLWMLKTYLKMNNMTEAARTYQKLKQRIAFVKNPPKNSSKKKKSSDEKPIPPLPKHFDYHYARVRAMYHIKTKDYKKALDDLKEALAKARKKKDKARISFIIGQLLQKEGNSKARDYYSLSIKKDAPFAMSFHAKVNRALVGGGSINEMVAELKDLAKEDMYFEYRDQIYFAMADLELKRPDRNQAKVDLTKSVFYSLNNNLQKGKSYEALGNLALEDKNYVAAQKYYDSSANVIPESYKNAALIKNKAEKLQDLVNNIQIVDYQDSMQMLAAMNEDQRKDFVKDVIKQLEKEAQERKEREAIRAEQLRKLQLVKAQENQKGGKNFYFSNPKAMQKGVEDFRSLWGQRENEDYWRLSTKPIRYVNSMMAAADSVDINDVDSSALASNNSTAGDWTVEDLLKNVPLTDSALKISNEKLMDALFNSGLIYKEQLKENELAAVQFKRVLAKKIENKNNLPSAFQLFKIYENKGEATKYKNYILENYPNSDYANYLKDPDYFIKKRKRDALALKNYMRSVEHFEHGLYYPVVLKADQVINNEPKNKFRKEYMLLKAMAMGRLNNDKTTLLPVLKQAVKEYPGTDVAKRAQELIGLINNGVPTFQAPKAKDSALFSFESSKYYVLILLNDKQKINYSSSLVSNFNKVYYRRLDLVTNTQVYMGAEEINFVMVDGFNSSTGAADYIKDFKTAKRFVTTLNSNKIIFISKENLKIVLQQQKLNEYLKFFNKELK